MEEEFNIRTLREGTAKSTPDIEAIFNAMGGDGFRTRYLGTVAAVVEKSGGRITKQRLNWGDDNDPKFNETHQKNADALLAATVKAVEGGGDPTDLRTKFTTK